MLARNTAGRMGDVICDVLAAGPGVTASARTSRAGAAGSPKASRGICPGHPQAAANSAAAPSTGRPWIAART